MTDCDFNQQHGLALPGAGRPHLRTCCEPICMATLSVSPITITAALRDRAAVAAVRCTVERLA